MKYTVIWRPTAERKLAELWNSDQDRKAITDAANALDALLRSSPLEIGESRAGNSRVLTVFPLSLYYDVYEEDKLVAVWAVWRVRER